MQTTHKTTAEKHKTKIYSMIQYFNFPKWDRFVICSTTVIALLTLVALIIPLCTDNVLYFFIPVILLTTLFITFLYMPVKLGLDEKNIYIKQVKGVTAIPFASIKKITPIETENLSNAIRIFGSGGVFGYIGSFRNKQLGNFTMYATSGKDLICIETITKKYVVNCTDNEIFTERLSKRT